MKLIPAGEFFAEVDDEDFEFLSQFKWHAHKDVNTYYAATGHVKVFLHGLLVDYPMVDHVDGNGLNNQRSNLRPATDSQNSANRRKAKTGKETSLFKGVSRNGNGWLARVRLNYEIVFRKHFQSEVKAALAYDDAARHHFGEYARLNFPKEGEQGCK